MRSSKGSPNPRYFLATLTTSRRFFSIRRRLARLSPERAFRERLTSWRRVKRTPLPIFAKYSAKSSGASKPRGAASPLSCSGSTAGAGVTVPDRTAFFLFTRLPPLFHSACLEDLRSLCRRPAPLLSSHARDDARPTPRRLRDSRNPFARRFCCTSCIISSRRCLQTCKSIISHLSDTYLSHNPLGCPCIFGLSVAESGKSSRPRSRLPVRLPPGSTEGAEERHGGTPSSATILRHASAGSPLRRHRGRVVSRNQPPANRQSPAIPGFVGIVVGAQNRTGAHLPDA